MDFYRMAYNGIASGLFLALFPPFWVYTRMTGKYRNGLGERLGHYPEALRRRGADPPRIWIHAASVGEAGVALSIMNALDNMIPGCTLILSTTTEHGRRYADKRISSSPLKFRTACVFAPIDLVMTTRRALAALQPDVLACVETELWPNWLMEAGRKGVKTALINGRISVRSIGNYLKIRPLMATLLTQVDAFSMIHEADARRIAMMGAPVDRIEIHGNAKFDIPMEDTADSKKDHIRALYGVTEETPVFIAGSIRGEEDAMILSAYARIVQEIPKTLLILAPRHIERGQHIVQSVKARGFSCQVRTDLAAEGGQRKAQVVILDTIGELQSIYSVADVVFCGGSLVPTGGHNVLEAAVQGKPVLYGPSMEDFLDAKRMLDQSGGGVQVQDVNELTDNTLELLRHPDKARDMGRRAREAIALNKGAARRHADVIRRLLDARLTGSLQSGTK